MKLFAKPGRSPRMRGGTLLTISVLLIGSALLRLGLQAPAIAREVATAEDIENPASVQPFSQIATSAELQVLINALNTRKQTLDLREARLQERAKALEITETAIENKLSALLIAEERLASTLALADGATEQDLSRLTSVYEKMKPKQSAALFEEMDPEFAAGFLGRMKPDIAAEVMAGLSPMAAYSISVILAGRNTSVPTE